MRYLFALLALLAITATASAEDVLPFPVTLGGQQATMTDKSTITSYIAAPVAADAAMAVTGVEGQIIVNIFPSDENANPVQGQQPMILLFDASGSKAISANMQGTKPAPGWYLANVVGGGKTSRVTFQVK
jgi:hypothetical protein